MQWAPSSRKSTKMLINPDRFLECGGCLFSFTRARVNCKYAHWIGGWSPRCMCTHLWRKRCRRHWHCFTFTILMWNRFVWCQFRSNNESRFDFFYLILKSSTRFPHSTTPLNLVMVSFADTCRFGSARIGLLNKFSCNAESNRTDTDTDKRTMHNGDMGSHVTWNRNAMWMSPSQWLTVAYDGISGFNEFNTMNKCMIFRGYCSAHRYFIANPSLNGAQLSNYSTRWNDFVFCSANSIKFERIFRIILLNWMAARWLHWIRNDNGLYTVWCCSVASGNSI